MNVPLQFASKRNDYGNGPVPHLSPLERERARSDELYARACAWADDVTRMRSEYDFEPRPAPISSQGAV